MLIEPAAHLLSLMTRRAHPGHELRSQTQALCLICLLHPGALWFVPARVLLSLSVCHVWAAYTLVYLGLLIVGFHQSNSVMNNVYCLDVGITESKFMCVCDETRWNKHLFMIMFELVKILMLL